MKSNDGFDILHALINKDFARSDRKYEAFFTLLKDRNYPPSHAIT